MNIVKTSEGARRTLALEGRLDTMSAPQLEAEVKEKDEKLRANEITIRKLENEIYNLKKQNMRNMSLPSWTRTSNKPFVPSIYLRYVAGILSTCSIKSSIFIILSRTF